MKGVLTVLLPNICLTACIPILRVTPSPHIRRPLCGEKFEILDEDLSGFNFADDGVKPDEREWSATWTRLRAQMTPVVWPSTRLNSAILYFGLGAPPHLPFPFLFLEFSANYRSSRARIFA